MTKHAARRAPGFTLVEVVVASAVLIVALAGTVAAVVSGARLARTNAETRAATRGAAAVLEQIRGAPFAEILATYHGRSFPVEGLDDGEWPAAAEVTVERADDESSSWTVYRVVVDVRWTRADGPRSVPVATYVCDRAGGAK